MELKEQIPIRIEVAARRPGPDPVVEAEEDVDYPFRTGQYRMKLAMFYICV